MISPAEEPAKRCIIPIKNQIACLLLVCAVLSCPIVIQQIDKEAGKWNGEAGVQFLRKELSDGRK
jgi:hypothetical protein